MTRNLDRARTADLVHRAVPVFAAIRVGFAVWMVPFAADPTRRMHHGADAVALTRMIGGRELALGAGTFATWRRGRPVAVWLAAQAVADAGDALAFVLATRSGQLSRRSGTLMALSALSGVAAELPAAWLLHRDGR